jgi:spoIIIJ-associated protein
VAETLATDDAVTDADLSESASETSPTGADDVATDAAAEAKQAGAPDDGTDAADADDAGTSDEARSARRRASEDLLVQEGDVAGDYLERLLDLVDYDGDIDLDVADNRAVVSIDGGEDLEKLVGSRGAGLEALQELTRLAVQQQTGVRSRLMLDIAQWRAARRSELTDLGRSTAERVRDGGESARLQPMTPFERKIVHDAVATVDGVHSESEGEEPRRRVVVFRSA